MALINNNLTKSSTSILFNIFTRYDHQMPELIQIEAYPTLVVHRIIWTFSLVTYLIALPIAVRMFRLRTYHTIMEYFSVHIIVCAFVAWIPALILIIYHLFEKFALRFCRFHYIILSTSSTVPLFFVFYMIIDRFIYAHPSFRTKIYHMMQINYVYLYSIFIWLFVMLFYAIASPFERQSSDNSTTLIMTKFCGYNYKRLRIIAMIRSITYFISFLPGLIAIGFVIRYFWQMRDTNQIPSIQKFWTIRTLLLLTTLVFHEIFMFYLDNASRTYNSFMLLSILESTFYLSQILIILLTEPYWLEILTRCCSCLCCSIISRKRKQLIPVALPAEIEMTANRSPYVDAHYSIVDNRIIDEFDRATDGPEPTLRMIV